MHSSLVALGCRNIAVALLAPLLLVGCATAAQRQYQTMASAVQSVLAQAKVCTSEIYNAPEAAPLRAHSPQDMREASLTQLSDSSLATKQEADAIIALHPRVKVCQKAILDGFMPVDAAVIPILTKSYAEGDDDTIQLLQKKMTWGERVHRGRDRSNILLAALQAEGQRVTAGLERQHESELARRQAAANAMAQWAQTQQVVNAVNRPVFTNCTGTGSMVNCISH